MKKTLSVIMVIVMLVSISSCANTENETIQTSQYVAKHMGIGLNLGNTMEAYGLRTVSR